MISSAFITPHSPILIPTIGKSNTDILNKTVAAYQKIAAKLAANPVDTAIFISPHQSGGGDFFSINIAPEFIIQFERFGDLATKIKVPGDLLLAHELKEDLKKKTKVQLTGNKFLDYGSAIPYYLLAPVLKNVKIITIAHAASDNQSHFEFGRLLQEELIVKQQKIAIIASGDLSHRLKRTSPGGYSPKGAKFDNKIIEYLNDADSAAENILKMDPKFITEVMECGLNSIMMLLGILDKLSFAPQVLAYQTELGIGYLTMDMNLEMNQNIKS